MMKSTVLACVACALFSGSAFAGPEKFVPGAYIEGFGRYAPVADAAITPDVQFKIAYDVSSAAEAGQINRGIESAARFLNMVTAAGVPAENVKLAIVVHGAAAADLQRLYADGTPNPNAALLEALIAKGVSVQLCGQTAAMRDVEASSLVPGVAISLSAMTAHALLQQAGYTVNPF
ncbi:MAG TPA: DsrE family protein [Hyphomonas sp.]|nr:DsrE family protein [Hyphomonas sp.]HRK66011.1 DsrE family protein [Hyphomonas sp.]